jgi:tRNA_anti-like
MIRLISCTALFALTLSFLGCKSHTPVSTAPAPGPAIAVKAGDLLKEYGANAVAADAKYKGKVVQVTGKFGSASKVIALGYAVTVLPEDAGEGDVGLTNVQCFIVESAQADVAKFQQGATVTMEGTCEGQTLAQIKMMKCTVVK